MEKSSLTPQLSGEAHVISLEEFIARYVSELPQIVQVGEGFCGTSDSQSVKTGDVLIIYKVERKRKIQGQHSESGRTLCLPRKSDLKLELVSEYSEDELTTLDAVAKLSSKYVRIVENIPLFGLLAGDILQFNREPPYLNLGTVRCFIVNLKDPVQVDLPLCLEGRFQVLTKHGIFSTDEVLRNCQLPVNVHAVSYGNKAMVDGSYEHPRAKQGSIFGNILLECEVEEEVVCAISTREQNMLLMFPSTLEITVSQYMSRERFMSFWGAEFEKLLKALPNEKVLHELSNANCISSTSDPVNRYSLESFQQFCFPFDRERGKETQVSRVGYGSAFEPPSRKEKTTTEEKGFQKFQPKSFPEINVPPLPPKKTLTATRSQASSQEDSARNFDHKQETEMLIESFEIIDRQEELSTQSLMNDLNDNRLPLRQSCDKLLENTLQLQEGSKQRDVSDAKCKMQISRDILYESEDPMFLESFTKRKAYEPPVDENANLPSDEGLPVDRKREQSAARVLHPAQTGSEAAGDEQSSREKEADLDFNSAPSKANINKKHNMQDDEEAFSQQSDEDNNNFDSLELGCSEKTFFDLAESNTEISEQYSRVTSPGADSKEEYRMNGESTRRRLFQSLTLRPKWFRPEAGRGGKKKEQALKEKSDSMPIPGKKGAKDCEQILISSPRDDDFESMSNIRKYLETQERLERALAEINRLQNERPENFATGSTPKNSDESVDAHESGLWKFDKRGSTHTESDAEKQNGQTVFLEQTGKQTAPHTPANTSVQSLPAPETVASRQPIPSWLNQNPRQQETRENCGGESYGRRSEMPYNKSPHSAIEPTHTESVMLLNRASQRENGQSHDGSRRENDENGPYPEDSDEKCCSCMAHFPGALSEEFSEGEVKSELKKTIQQTNWTTGELMELIEILRGKIMEVNRVPYVNLTSQARQRSLFEDHINAHYSSSSPAWNEVTRKDLPPYVNVSQASREPIMSRYQNLVQEPKESSTVTDSQRSPNRSRGKPPIPTPRSTPSSI